MPKLEPGHVIGAFDPGVTTGLAVGLYVRNGEFELLNSIEIPWAERFEHIMEVVPKLDWIVYERFALYKSHAKEMTNNEFPSVQFIGAIQMAAYLAHKSDRLIVQPAHERRNVSVLQKHLPMVRGSQHRIDAYQHLRYCCLLHKHDK